MLSTLFPLRLKAAGNELISIYFDARCLRTEPVEKGGRLETIVSKHGKVAFLQLSGDIYAKEFVLC